MIFGQKCKYYLGSMALIILVCIVSSAVFANKIIHNKHCKLSISIPDQMLEIVDSANSIDGQLFYDTTADVILQISGRSSRFKSVKDYIDCTHEQLEDQLKYDYEDSSLTLVNCSRYVPDPERVTVILMRVSVLPRGYDTHQVYFIHHRHKDIQIFFTYKQEHEKRSQAYIDAIMRTFQLK
jgi:hypothetical protein